MKLDTIRSPEVAGCDDAQVGTWVRLSLYCVEKENAGRIRDCIDWTPIQWQRLIGIDSGALERECPLWSWDGRDLVVSLYPLEQEERFKMKREIGRRGGLAKGKDRSEAPNIDSDGDKDVDPDKDLDIGASAPAEPPAEAHAKKHQRRNKPKAGEYERTPRFEEFWGKYPRKADKIGAHKMWLKLDDADRQSALDSIPHHVESWRRERRDESKIPHGSTWLNHKRWCDELPTSPSGDDGWVVKTYRKTDLDQYGGGNGHPPHENWEAYTKRAANLDPWTVEPFEESPEFLEVPVQ